jgi:integrase
MFTDRDIRGLKPKAKDYYQTEKTRTRGSGRLAVRVRPNGNKEWMFVYWVDRRRKVKKIGTYPTISLADARTQAAAFSKLYQQGLDVRAHLEEQEKAKRAESDMRASQGTLKDLLNSYLGWMDARGRRSTAHVRSSLERYVFRPFPVLVNKKARDITVQDIRRILQRMLQRGVTTHANRVRSYLHAAFQHGFFQETNPRTYLTAPISFGLAFNPVSGVPRQDDYERVGQRTLCAAEIRHVWNRAVELIGPYRGTALKLALATGGQRTGELLQLRWVDIDRARMILTIPQTISKNKREHLVPLGRFAEECLTGLADAERESDWLFPSNVKGRHIVAGSLSCATRGLCDDLDLPRFSPRDLRRTAKTLMGEAGIEKSIRDRLQNHSFHDVSSKHYDRYDYLAEKRFAIDRWDEFLAVNLMGDSDTVTPIRQATTD